MNVKMILNNRRQVGMDSYFRHTYEPTTINGGEMSIIHVDAQKIRMSAGLYALAYRAALRDDVAIGGSN